MISVTNEVQENWTLYRFDKTYRLGVEEVVGPRCRKSEARHRTILIDGRVKCYLAMGIDNHQCVSGHFVIN